MLFFALLVYHRKSITSKKPRPLIGITYDPAFLTSIESLRVVNKAIIDSPGVVILQTNI